MSNLKTYIRAIFRKVWNKQSLPFFFFLALSTAFWFFQTLNEVYEQDFDVPVEFREMPRGVVITSDTPTSVKVTLRDRGVTLLNYKYGDNLPKVVIDQNVFSQSEGRVRLLAADMLKQLRSNLASGTQVLGIRPDTLEFYYNHGKSKRVPVRLKGKPTAASGYTIAGQRITPDSVTVYAATAVLDTLQAVYVRADQLSNITASTAFERSLQSMRGVKLTPSKVKLAFAVDRMVEKKLTVPVVGENFPENVRLRTFPAQIEVTFQVRMALYRTVHAGQFVVAVDYNQLPSDGGSKCRLKVKSMPAGVSHVRLASDEVEYVLETE